ncbi:MAG TPA: AraC family transcriptional regulator, partial [Methylomirabilota bacterium]
MKAATSNDCRARIDRVLTHLADHLDADLSVAELARIAHFLPYHFHRMFRAMTGESVATVVRRLRLETAGRALREWRSLGDRCRARGRLRLARS